jgi:ERCC4-related helicase
MFGKSLDEILGSQVRLTDKDKNKFLSDCGTPISSVEAKRRNLVIVECPKCHVSGNEPNMRRWHFDRCAQPLLNCKQCTTVIKRQGIKPWLYKQKKYCSKKCFQESSRGVKRSPLSEETKKRISIAKRR